MLFLVWWYLILSHYISRFTTRQQLKIQPGAAPWWALSSCFLLASSSQGLKLTSYELFVKPYCIVEVEDAGHHHINQFSYVWGNPDTSEAPSHTTADCSSNPKCGGFLWCMEELLDYKGSYCETSIHCSSSPSGTKELELMEMPRTGGTRGDAMPEDQALWLWEAPPSEGAQQELSLNLF